jgi:anti-sigma B factor antagonist
MENWFEQSTRREIDPTFVPLRSPRPNNAVVDLSVEPSGDACIVRVQTAKLTYPVLSSFFEEVRSILDAGTRNLVLDMAAVTYIDSATIGCLVDIHRLVGDRGGEVKLSGLQRRVHTMLSMTGVDRFLEIYDVEAEALASLGWPREASHHA